MSRCNVCFHSTVIRIKNVGLFLVGSSYVSPRRGGGGGGLPPMEMTGMLVSFRGRNCRFCSHLGCS